MKKTSIVFLTVFICLLPLFIAYFSLPADKRSLPSFSLSGFFSWEEASPLSEEEQDLLLAGKDIENMPPVERLYELGHAAYMNKDYDTAIRHFGSSLDLDNKHYKSLNGMGIALYFKGQYELGMAYMDRAIELNPDYVYAHFSKGLAYELISDFENAMVWYDKAIELAPGDPQNAWSYYGKARIYARTDDFSMCMENFKKAIEMNPSVKEAAKTEKDFDNVKDREEFNNLIINLLED